MMNFRYDARAVVFDVSHGSLDVVRQGGDFAVSPIMPSDDMSIMAQRVAYTAAGQTGHVPHREIVARVRCDDGTVACVHLRTVAPSGTPGVARECIEPQCMSRTE